MTNLFRFCAFLSLILGQWRSYAIEEINSQKKSKAEIFFNQSFQTDDSDSILYLLDLAIKEASIEGNGQILVESIFDKAREYERRQDGDSSQYYYQRGIETARTSILPPKLMAWTHLQYGYHLGHQNEYIEALSHLDSAAILYLAIPDSAKYGDVLSRTGAVYDNNGDLAKALGYYLEAFDVYKALNDSSEFPSVMNNVAIIYKKLGDYEGSLEYYNRSIDLLSEPGDEYMLAASLLNRAMLYKQLNQNKKALSGVHQALVTFEDKKDSYGIAISHHNLAEIFLNLNNIDSVLYHVDQSQKISIDLQYWIIVVSNQIVLSKALEGMGRADISNKSALRAYELANEHGFLEKLEEITELLADNYEQVGNYKLALRFHKEYKQFQDSLSNMKSQGEMNRLRTQYDLKQKEESIHGLEMINSYQASLTEKEEKIIFLLIVGMIISLLVVGLFFYLYQRKRTLAKELSLQKVKLTDLNKEKDDLIAMVAHDLRSPLNNIKGLLGLIKDAEGEEQDTMLDLANQSTNVLRTRINQILDIEAINVGKINLKITSVSVSDILTQLISHITPEAGQKNISFDAESEGDLNCQADENYLLQVLENLCTNAIKFSKQKSAIHVKVSDNGGKLRFEVNDQGQGIPKGEIDKLFNRYAKISTLPTENEKSTGLGLPIVKKYVEAMGGKVWCESEVGEGSTFYFELPKAK